MKRTQTTKAVPKELSRGEEEFALHCKADGIDIVREYPFDPTRKWRLDFWFPEANLAVEIDGGTRFGMSRHSRGDGYESDCRKLNAAALAGIRVLRFTSRMVKSGEAIDAVRTVLEVK